MSISLRDAMSIYPFSRAVLVSGHKGLLREVVSANIQEVPNVDRWLKGGEILFTSGFAFQNAQNGCAMMERLDKVGVAALAIKPGQYLPEIPEEMINTSNRIGLPLFELPEDLAYMDCIIPIFEHITQKQLTALRRVELVHNSLTEAVVNSEGLEGICRVFNRIMDTPVFITTTEGSILACVVNEAQNTRENYLENMREILEKHISELPVGLLKKNQRNIPDTNDGVKLMIVPVYVREENIAHIVLDISENELTDIDALALEQADSVVALELLNERSLLQMEYKIREQLLDDLIMKRYSDEKLIIQRGRYLGIDLERKYCLFVIDADSFEGKLKDMGVFSEEKVQKIKVQVRQIISDEMMAFRLPSLILDSSVGCVGLICLRKESDIMECKKVINSILLQLKQIPGGPDFSAGIGRVKQGIRYIEDGRWEAMLAMRAGRNMNHSSKKCAHTFEELGCLCFLSELANSKAMRAFYNDNLQPLIDYDNANGTELEKTLECYFMNGKNLRKTAEALFMHKNSIIYRISKIESLLSKNMDDYHAAFDLQLCFKLKNIM